MYQFAEANPYSEITIQIMRKKRCCHPSQKIKILESEIQKTKKKKKSDRFSSSQLQLTERYCRLSQSISNETHQKSSGNKKNEDQETS